MPQGHSRSTSNRLPSVPETESYARFDVTIAAYLVSASLGVRVLRNVPDRGPNTELERPRHGLERDR